MAHAAERSGQPQMLRFGGQGVRTVSEAKVPEGTFEASVIVTCLNSWRNVHEGCSYEVTKDGKSVRYELISGAYGVESVANVLRMSGIEYGTTGGLAHVKLEDGMRLALSEELSLALGLGTGPIEGEATGTRPPIAMKKPISVKTNFAKCSLLGEGIVASFYPPLHGGVVEHRADGPLEFEAPEGPCEVGFVDDEGNPIAPLGGWSVDIRVSPRRGATRGSSKPTFEVAFGELHEEFEEKAETVKVEDMPWYDGFLRALDRYFSEETRKLAKELRETILDEAKLALGGGIFEIARAEAARPSGGIEDEPPPETKWVEDLEARMKEAVGKALRKEFSKASKSVPKLVAESAAYKVRTILY